MRIRHGKKPQEENKDPQKGLLAQGATVKKLVAQNAAYIHHLTLYKIGALSSCFQKHCALLQKRVCFQYH